MRVELSIMAIEEPCEVGEWRHQVSLGPASGLLPGPAVPGVVLVWLPGEEVLMPGSRGRPPGKGGCQAAAPGSEVGLQSEPGAGGGVLLPPAGVAGEGGDGLPRGEHHLPLLLTTAAAHPPPVRPAVPVPGSCTPTPSPR